MLFALSFSIVLAASSAFASPQPNRTPVLLPSVKPTATSTSTIASHTATSHRSPVNVAAGAAATPTFQVLVPPPALPVESVLHWAGATVPQIGSTLSIALVALQKRARLATGPAVAAALPACLDSTANDTIINTLFYHGASTVYLCPTAVISLNYTLFFFATGQTLTTQANSQGLRGTLQIANPAVSCAIYAVDSFTSQATISNIQINGERSTYGMVTNGPGLMEVGGNSLHLTVQNVLAYDPRGWTVIHISEGYNNGCTNAQILNNQFQRSGYAPSGPNQFKRDTTVHLPGEWADGISMACPNSVVSGNQVTDATDGGIVLFAPGCSVINNVITANERQFLGGINMVDYFPFLGNFTGTTISGNVINAQASMIKIGIAVGTLTWQGYNVTWGRGFGGSIKNNQLISSSSSGYFGMGISVAGMNSTTVTGNNFLGANFGGVSTSSCDPYYPIPAPGPMYYGPYTTPGCTLQKTFVPATFDFAICAGPGSVTKSKYTLLGSLRNRHRDLLEPAVKRSFE